MDLNGNNNKKAYEILSYFQSIDLFFKNYYYNRKDIKVP